MPSQLISFSYRVPPHVPARARLKALIIDVRDWGNPYRVPSLRMLTGKDHAVGQAIKQLTSGYEERFLKLCRRVADHPGPVYLGCQAGRHRSVFLAEELGRVFGLTPTHLGLTIGGNRTHLKE